MRRTAVAAAAEEPRRRHFVSRPRIFDELEARTKLIGLQIGALVVVGLTFLLWLVVEQFVPDLFNPGDHWCTTEDVLVSVQQYWPMLAWGGALALLSSLHVSSFIRANELLVADSITSILAGVWEELGYRCIFIFTAMIGLWFTNQFFFWVVVGVTLLLGLVIAAKSGNAIAGIIVLGVTGVFLWWFSGCGLSNPLYWWYERVIFPVLNWVSLGYLQPVLYHPAESFLFIAGAVSANAKFRDGHKYQGLVGFLNAWAMGFVLLHIMLYHGLLVAIIVHAIYDLEFAFIRYGARRLAA